MARPAAESTQPALKAVTATAVPTRPTTHRPRSHQRDAGLRTIGGASSTNTVPAAEASTATPCQHHPG